MRPWVTSVSDHALVYAAALLALAPAGYLVWASFDMSGLGQAYRFGWNGWLGALSAPATLGAVGTSFVLALRVVPALAIGLFISWALVRRSIPCGGFIESSIWFAFFLPSVPMAVAWTLLLHPAYGLINAALAHIPFLPVPLFSIQSFPGIMWVHLTVSTVPFFVIVLMPAVRQIDATFEEAARVSGARAFQTALRITYPLLAPAILAGLLAAYSRSLESFEVEQVIGPPVGIFVFATRIYDLIREDPPLIAQAMALSCLFLLAMALLAAVQYWWLRRSPPVVTVRSQGQRREQVSRRASTPVLLAVVILLYLAASIYLPVATLVMGSFNKIFGFFAIPQPWTVAHWTRVLTDPRFGRAFVHTIELGGGAGLLFVPIYLRLAWILARRQVAGGSTAMLLLWLPWAIPGFALGLALLEATLRIPPLSPLYGTFVPVLIGIFVKELPIAVHFLRGALEQTGRELEDAARVAGASAFRVFRQITLPLISSTVVAVFVLIFAAAAREIATIVLVAGPGTETVSLLMFDYASNGRNESAAVVGVLFAVLAVPLAILFRGKVVIGGLR